MRKKNVSEFKVDSVLFFRSYYETSLMVLNEESERLKFYEAIFEYNLNGNTLKLEGNALALFRLFRPNMDAQKEKYLIACKKIKPEI